MIYRIDMQHFLSHAIDHFTIEELTHFQYAIISSKIRNGGRVQNVSKLNSFYPPPEIIIDYSEHKDKSIMGKQYMDFLSPKKSNDMGMTKSQMANMFYTTFINNIINHVDIVIICDKTENDYIDIICKVLKKDYGIEVIDLNELFIKGEVGPIYIDRDKIWDNAVDIRREAGKDQIRALESSSGGRLKLLNMMTKKQKIKKIEELGIAINNYNNDDLNSILMDAWVNDDEDN